jgi:signal transduction histidine kinase
LLFLALSVVLTALAISLLTALLGYRSGRERVIDQLESVVTLKQHEISAWASNLELNLDIVLSETGIPGNLHLLTSESSTEDVRRQAHDQILERFMWAAERMGLFEELFFMDTGGVVQVSTNPGHEGQRLGLNDYFTEGLNDKFLQQPSYSLSLGKMTIVASAPVREEERTLGVIAGRADLKGLNEIMIERAGLGETGETYLVGSNYRLLTYLRWPGYSIPDTYIRTEGTEAAVGSKEGGSKIYRSYAGTPVIGVYRWIPELQLALMAEQEQAEALRTTELVLLVVGGVALLAAALAILAGHRLTRRIVRPLADLGSTAGRIAAGELDLEAAVEREDEIGTLAHSFNSMTARLRDLVRSHERRTDHLRAINEAGRQISAILDLGQLLPYVATSLLKTFNYRSVRILLLTDLAAGTLLTCNEDAECGEPVAVDLGEPLIEPVASEAGAGLSSRLPAITTVAKTWEPALVPWEATAPAGATAEFVAPAGAGTATNGGTAAEAGPRAGAVAPSGAAYGTGAYSEIAIPIRIKEELVGVLDIIAREVHPLDEQDLFAARTLADQLAIAIENSRLYEHADELAASRERQRLARDLHDAVSQTLFSASLIAEVLPRVYERDPEEGRRHLEELRQLTRGALAEMRALLLELRPAALAEANLPDLLKQLSETVVSRARIPVEVEAEESCIDLPSDVRIAFYRIAQEAFNNVVKHSAATKASVKLSCEETGIRLMVEDDGVGFDPAEPGTGELGLGIMHERAAAVGATLEVQSQPQQGTRILVTWSPPA